MRVTNTMINSQVVDSLASAQERLFESQRQLSSTKEVDIPSDDPVRFARASNFKNIHARNDQYLQNIINGRGWITDSLAALNSMWELMQQIKVTGLKAADDANSSVRPLLADDVNGHVEELVFLGNFQFDNKSIFAGTKTEGVVPFTFDGASVTFNGNSTAIKRKTGDNSFVDINVIGSDFQSIFTSAVALRDAIISDDATAIGVALGDVETAIDDLMSVIVAAASTDRTLELTEQHITQANFNIENYISQTEDVDVAEAVLNFNSHELGFRAALQTGSRVLDRTLMDFLR